jgi:hypothetical protein
LWEGELIKRVAEKPEFRIHIGGILERDSPAKYHFFHMLLEMGRVLR